MDKYTVYEVADMLQTSHTTIYNKLNNKDIYKDIRKFITKQGKVRYVSGEGIEVLKKYINSKESDSKFTSKKEIQCRECAFLGVGSVMKETLQEIDSNLIVELRERIKSLENQLSVKDSHIESLLKQNENSQILLKHHQDRILLIEETKDEGNKSWFRKWFG